ncbi:MAG: hypothetical protein IJ566_02440 [Cardiobacteriaceae bacterium]|nr:hypothetical protein [Cardiobacteriaceae bacterium]
MKKILLFAVISFLTACESMSNIAGDENRLYEIKMVRGGSLYAKSKPKADADGFYHFEDVNKQSYSIKKNLVLAITPAKVKK